MNAKKITVIASFFYFSTDLDAQPFINHTELYIKSNSHSRDFAGDDASNGERHLVVNSDSSKFEYCFNNTEHVCYKSTFTPFTDGLLQRSIDFLDKNYRMVRSRKEWRMQDEQTELSIVLEYSDVSNQFVLVYRLAPKTKL